MVDLVKVLLLIVTTLYQAIACWREDQTPPPGDWVDVGGYRLHLQVVGDAQPTIVLDHSLGGSEGYVLIEKLATLGRVCIYDRAGYGWSDHSPKLRTSQSIVTELDTALTQAGVTPPYILIGDSFGSYNVRLYADQFPDKVVGMVLTDGLHETGMLHMSVPLKALWLFFVSGFFMSTVGAGLGIVRLLERVGVFEWLKPELTQCSASSLRPIKRSFCRPKHWITMSREMLNLRQSARQVSHTQSLGTMPLVSIKSHSFFKPSVWTAFVPLRQANQLRDRMHVELLRLSTDSVQLQADQSGHFVWIDQPDVIIDAVKIILDKIEPCRLSSPKQPFC